MCARACALTYSWSRTPVAAWPSNCCCCRMLSKSSMRWSEFSMWAGRWQLRKQMVWPNTDMRALTPPLLPCNIQKKRGSYVISKRGRNTLVNKRLWWFILILLTFISFQIEKVKDWMKWMIPYTVDTQDMSVFSLHWVVRAPVPQRHRKFTH